MCDKSIQRFIQSQATESAKSMHLNVSVRAGVIGAVFWELPGCSPLQGCIWQSALHWMHEKRDGAVSLEEWARCWRRGCSGGGTWPVPFVSRTCFQSLSEPQVGELCLAEPCACIDVLQGLSTNPVEA